MFLPLLFLLLNDFSIRTANADSFSIKNAFMPTEERIYLLSTDGRVAEYSSPTQKEAEYAVNANDGRSRVVSLLPIPERNVLWVSDIGLQQIRKYEDGQNTLTIENTKTFRILSIPNSTNLLLCPPATGELFIKLDKAGQQQTQFKVAFPWKGNAYQNKIWHTFNTYQLSDGRLLLAFAWANKWLLLNADGTEATPFDLTPFYSENRVNHMPAFMAHAGAAVAKENAVWILTCSHETTSCKDFLLIDFVKQRLLATARSKHPLTLFKRLATGHYLTIDKNQSQANFTKAFPFEATSQP